MADGKLSVEIGAKLTSLEQAVAKSNALLEGFDKKVSSISKNTDKSFSGIGSAAKMAGSAIAAYFTFDALQSFAKSVISVTAEFQKFEAVLSNTLGSNSAAQSALNMIQDFAAKTPFSVKELTSSFVKLANQGFKPTVDQLRSLGDLASSTGKSFDQLAEAIIDAQTGEFERLKEFGIRAQKEGDKVMFTFKGVKQQVDFTAGSIREYILSLGNAEGVSGSMAKISDTLGGKISNLGDSWDRFQKQLGEANSGGLKNAIGLLDKFLGKLIDIERTDAMAVKLGIDQRDGGFFSGELGNIIGVTSELQDENKKLVTIYDKLTKAIQNTNSEDGLNGLIRNFTILQERVKASPEAWKIYTQAIIDAGNKIQDLRKEAERFKDTPIAPKVNVGRIGKFSVAEDAADVNVDLSKLQNKPIISDLEAQNNLLRSTGQIIAEVDGKAIKFTQTYGKLGAQIEEVGIKTITVGSQISNSVVLTAQQLAAQTYLIQNIGGIISSSFEDMLVNGNDVFKSLVNGLKALIAKLIAAAIAAAALSVILSSTGLGAGMSFGKIFGQMSGLGGIINSSPSIGMRTGVQPPVGMQQVEIVGQLVGQGDQLLAVVTNAQRTRNRITG